MRAPFALAQAREATEQLAELDGQHAALQQAHDEAKAEVEVAKVDRNAFRKKREELDTQAPCTVHRAFACMSSMLHAMRMGSA